MSSNTLNSSLESCGLEGYDIFKRACEFYQNRHLDTKEISPREINGGINFFDSFYNSTNASEATLFHLSKGRNELMVKLGIKFLNSIGEYEDGQKRINLEALPEQLPKEPYNVVVCTASGETKVVREGLDRIWGSNNTNANILLFIGDKNSHVYETAEKIAYNGNNVAIIYYEASSKLEKGHELDTLGNVSEQFTLTHLAGLGSSASYSDYSAKTDIFTSYADDIINMGHDSLANIVVSLSNALVVGGNIYFGGKGSTGLVAEASHKRAGELKKAVTIEEEKAERPRPVYIPLTASGRKYNTRAVRSANIHPVIPSCAEPDEYLSGSSNGNIVEIPISGSHSLPHDAEYWYKAHFVNDAILKAVQTVLGITNEELIGAHEKDCLQLECISKSFIS